MEPRINHADGIITITDANTTIGYCRYDESGVIEYLFVGPQYRRRGHASRMLALVEERIGTKLRFQPPLSPLGRLVAEAYGRVAGAGQKRSVTMTGDGRGRVRT
jgi:ribosomal protein S18 acetylase RimI-like enzyme